MVNFCALEQAHVHGKKVVQRFAQKKMDKKLESHFLQTLKISCWLQKNIQDSNNKKTLPFLNKTHRQTHRENLSKKNMHSFLSCYKQTPTFLVVPLFPPFPYIFLKAPPYIPTTPAEQPKRHRRTPAATTGTSAICVSSSATSMSFRNSSCKTCAASSAWRLAGRKVAPVG